MQIPAVKMKVIFNVFYSALLSFITIILTGTSSYTQPVNDSTSKSFTLEQCVQFALENSPAYKEAVIDESIGERQIRIGLAGWFPQVTSQFNYIHNFILQTSAFGNQIVTIGRKNNSNMFIEGTQTLFSSDVILATRAAKYSRQAYQQNTTAVKINIVVDVNKAFYDILLSLEQLKIIHDNIVRQEKQYHDAYHRYEFGLNDKTDYQRAKITLANSYSDKKRAEESLKSKYAFLKQVIGYPSDSTVRIVSDIKMMEQNTATDTLNKPDYNNRIEFQQLQSQKQLLKLNTSYYKYGYLPTISAFANYNNIYFNNSFGELYSRVFPTSAGGLRVTLPVFQGFKRINNIRVAVFREHRAQVETENLKNVINTEYQTALANYKSSYKEWLTEKDNVGIAREVYGIIKLQYDEGIRAFLDIIVAENDLKASQINYYNALYRLLSARLDLEKATGAIRF